MHARRLDRGNRLHGARQLALESALIVELLGKLADAELLALHQLETDRSAARQSLRRESQADVMHAGGWHEDRAARVVEAERHVHLLERGNDRAAVAFADIGEEDAELALPEQRRRRNEQCDERGDGDHQHHLLPIVQACQGGACTFQRSARDCCIGGFGSGCRHASVRVTSLPEGRQKAKKG
ncbi:MAG: hypothetical protein AW12_03049 [Candidatus Accumulibacter sp. BA-94]|nr:MAG: hypothetical protein AW12_03049 [Candidatus Accumulibacter sp. BA-94]